MKDALGLTLGALLDIPFESRSPMQREAITAAREALAQPDYRAVKTYHEGKPVYVSQPEQEPVAWEVGVVNGVVTRRLASPTSPPKRPWVGLTDEQREACTQSPFTEDNYDDIEAKLKELNT